MAIAGIHKVESRQHDEEPSYEKQSFVKEKKPSI
jgi:hypothetical protein